MSTENEDTSKYPVSVPFWQSEIRRMFPVPGDINVFIEIGENKWQVLYDPEEHDAYHVQCEIAGAVNDLVSRVVLEVTRTQPIYKDPPMSDEDIERLLKPGGTNYPGLIHRLRDMVLWQRAVIKFLTNEQGGT